MALDQKKFKRLPKKNKKEAQRIFANLRLRLKEVVARAEAIRLEDVKKHIGL
ncbi:hypothetical protein HY624_03045 [Candidatus Uhrbacteria bacterium]|nr:hypothetical protein [Candidatus Uhrbacteria bacterium]